MPQTVTLLEEALESWRDARRGVIAELRRVPPNRIDFRPEPGARSVAELVQHTVDTAAMWTGELASPKGDFTRKSFPAFVRQYGTAAADRPTTRKGLIRLLRTQHAAGARAIRQMGDIGMLQRIRRFDGAEWTRLTWMHHGIAHEEYHRAQLALYVRLLGRTPALTKLIQDMGG